MRVKAHVGQLEPLGLRSKVAIKAGLGFIRYSDNIVTIATGQVNRPLAEPIYSNVVFGNTWMPGCKPDDLWNSEMPRVKTYGKRCRVVYDLSAAPAVGSSPEQVSSVRTQGGVDDAREGENNKEITDYQDWNGHRWRGAKERTLGERNPNEVAGGQNREQQQEKVKRRPRTARAVQDEDEQEVVTSDAPDKNALDNLPTATSQKRGVVSISQHEVLDSDQKLDVQEPHQTGHAQISDPDITLRSRQMRSTVRVKSSLRDHGSPNLLPALADEGLRQKTTVPEERLDTLVDVCTQHCSSLLSLSQHPLTDFTQWADELSEHFHITKIAEASFGEVYRLALQSKLPDFSRADESVFKIIALTPPPATLATDKRRRKAQLRRTEWMSKPTDVANEVRLLQRMTCVPGFTNFRDVRILRGRPGRAFVTTFRDFDAAQRRDGKEGSAFPDPALKDSYGEGQLWAAIEMQDAGTDLERMVEGGQCSGIFHVWDVFWQVVLSLAKGEEGAEFEHRDLHLGNICVRRRPDPAVRGDLDDCAIDLTKNVNFTNLETTIIDYTLSRAWMSSSGGVDDIAFHDLAADPAVFEGDSSKEYQYDIYRYMRSILFFDDPLVDFASHRDEAAAADRNWQQYHPQTNLIWLHLVIDKLLQQVVWPSAGKPPTKKKPKERARWKRALDLENALRKVSDLLHPRNMGQSLMQSTSDLVHLAIAESWLGVEDVMGNNLAGLNDLTSDLERLELADSNLGNLAQS